MADESHKGIHLVLPHKCFEKSKFRLNTQREKISLKKGYLNNSESVLAFVANKYQNEGKIFVYLVSLSWC